MSVIAEIGVQTPTRTASTSDAPARRRRARKRISALRCLVVSEDPDRLALIADAAADAGFQPIACSEVASAWLLSRRERSQLAFIDVGHAKDQSGLKDLGEHLSRSGDALVAICGDEAQPLEEIWARQIGAWLYLPGLAGREELSSLCTEARPVIEKLRG